jgi:secreted PhoX family phosphatase
MCIICFLLFHLQYVIKAYAGTGTAGSNGDFSLANIATLHSPDGITLDDLGNLYIADYSNNKIRKVNSTTGIITTFAGTGEQHAPLSMRPINTLY